VLFVLQFAFCVFGPNPVSTLLAAIIAFLPKIVVAIIIVVISAAIGAAVKTLIQGSLGGLSYGKTLANIASIFILRRILAFSLGPRNAKEPGPPFGAAGFFRFGIQDLSVKSTTSPPAFFFTDSMPLRALALDL
jgi:hypothetical protein